MTTQEYNRKYYAEHRVAILAKARRYATTNRDKVKAYQRAYRPEYHAANRPGLNAKSRRNFYLRKYGLTEAAYDAMLAAQGNRCAACRSAAPGGKYNRFHVDHLHGTKFVRGLLCAGCNIGIGFAKEDPARLRACADYLERHGGKHGTP